MPRILIFLSAALVLACGGDRAPATDADTATSGADTSGFRSLADSLAEEMARELAETTTRQGTWRVGDSTSQWTARFRDTVPVILEERLQIGSTVAVVRVFFFDIVGALEQISEQRTESAAGGNSRVTETMIEAQAGQVTAKRTVDGDTVSVPPPDITALRRRAAALLERARQQ